MNADTTVTSRPFSCGLEARVESQCLLVNVVCVDVKGQRVHVIPSGVNSE